MDRCLQDPGITKKAGHTRPGPERDSTDSVLSLFFAEIHEQLAWDHSVIQLPAAGSLLSEILFKIRKAADDISAALTAVYDPFSEFRTQFFCFFRT